MGDHKFDRAEPGGARAPDRDPSPDIVPRGRADALRLGLSCGFVERPAGVQSVGGEKAEERGAELGRERVPRRPCVEKRDDRQIQPETEAGDGEEARRGLPMRARGGEGQAVVQRRVDERAEHVSRQRGEQNRRLDRQKREKK